MVRASLGLSGVTPMCASPCSAAGARPDASGGGCSPNGMYWEGSVWSDSVDGLGSSSPGVTKPFWGDQTLLGSPGGTGTWTQGAEDGLPHLGLSSNPAIPGFEVVSRYSEPTMLLLCAFFFFIYIFLRLFFPVFFFCYLSDLRFFNGSANGTGSQM